ncbi:MAG: class II aldolase/adducin family protein, partial [Bacteroidales bacterium]
MRPEIKELIEISRFYGKDRNYVIAGGGNTSFKDEKTLWIKASGYALSDLDEAGLVALDREKLKVISTRSYAADPLVREEQVKRDLTAGIIDGDSAKRPSVETSLHDIINYRFVVHLHPTFINGILCSRNAGNMVFKAFGEKVLFVPYTDPGYTLFKKLEKEIITYRERHSADPQVIFLENHGVFAGANSTDEIRKVYDEIITGLTSGIAILPEPGVLPEYPEVNKLLPLLRMILSDGSIKVIRHRNNSLIAANSASGQDFDRISHPFTPDMVVYCRSR